MKEKDPMGKLMEEVKEFAEIGAKFVRGEISSSEFKGKSGGMGVYAQRGGKKFMIRFRIMSGILTREHFQVILNLAEEYGLDKLHLTTRQTIQLHDLEFDEVLQIMKEGIKKGLFTRGGGGNYPRNVALSPLSGVDPLEPFDPTQYSMAVNNHFLENMSSYHLPRKLKVAFSNKEEDSGVCRYNDIGFVAVNRGGHPSFQVYMGGGLGKEPQQGILFDELVDVDNVTDFVDALIQFYISEGDFTNKSKARLRFVLKRLGKQAFLSRFKEHLLQVQSGKNLYEPFKPDEGNTASVEAQPYESGIYEQKQNDMYTLVLHPEAGQLNIQKAKAIYENVVGIRNVDVRLGMDQSIYVRNLRLTNARSLKNLVPELIAGTMLKSSISCIGTPICQIGLQQSQKLLREILVYFQQRDLEAEKIMPRINISGCSSSCARHQTAAIGFSGIRKNVGGKVVDGYALFIGGEAVRQGLEFGKYKGDLLAERIPEFLYKLAQKAQKSNIDLLELLGSENQVQELIAEYLI